MRANLDITAGLIVSEAVMMGLGPHLGRQYAHDLVYDICRQVVATGRPLLDLLAENEEITKHMTRGELAKLVRSGELSRPVPARWWTACWRGRMTDLRDWIGRSETQHDVVTEAPVAAMPATLDDGRDPPKADGCRRYGTGSISCRSRGSPRSGPTGMRAAAASCRRCRCRAACGPAAGSRSTPRCASATRSRGCRPSRT